MGTNGKGKPKNEQKESLSHGKEIWNVLMPKLVSNSSVPEVDEDWGNQLWDAVKKTYGKTENETKPPIEEIDFDQKTLELEMRSDYGGCGLETFCESKVESFKTLPSYIG